MYFSIHNHSMFSNIRLIDSIIRPHQLIDQAIDYGLAGICLTDHEVLSGHVQFLQHYKKIREDNPDFKIGLGNEIYLTKTREPSQKHFHYILVAKNADGHRALRELSSTAWYNSYKTHGTTQVPTLYSELEDVVSRYPNSLIATTACLGGELSQLVLELNLTKDDETKQKIEDFLLFHKKLFGEDFYIEIAPSSSPDQLIFNKVAIQLGDIYDIKVVVATDSHYILQEDRAVHKSYLQSKHEKREVDAFYSYAYLMSGEQVKTNLLPSGFDEEQIQRVMVNTMDIYDKIEFYDLAKVQEIPLEEVTHYDKDFTMSPNFKSLAQMAESEEVQNRYWVQECLTSLSKMDKMNDEYLDRLNTEADVLLHISDKLQQPLTGYFNTFRKYIDLFWEAGSIVGPGRGSAVGFLSDFLLGITQIDPIKYNLPWFRFLNKERVELPDIDIDLAPSKRPLIFEKIREQKGETYLLQVATFGTEGTRSSILAGCRGYRSKEHPTGIDIDSARYLTGLIPSERGILWNLSDVVNGNKSKGRKKVHNFATEIARYPGLLDIVMSIEGLVNKRSQHASGVVLYNASPYETTAIMRSPSGDLTTQFSLYDVEYMGRMKFDFLVTEVSDKMITAIDLLQADGAIDPELSLKEVYKKFLHPDILPLKDTRIWDSLGNNSVLDAFQFNTPVGSMAAKMVKPTSIAEMTAANALMRLMGERGKEAPLEKYVRFKGNHPTNWYKEMDSYGLTLAEREIVRPYYEKEYGVPPYQESIMLSLMDEGICDFSLKDSNGARKIVAKKKMGQINELKKKVFDSATTSNMANYIWDTCVAPQLGYGFSELHSLAYSFVGVQTLFLATNFPSIYWNTACLVVNAGMVDIDWDEKPSEDSLEKKQKVTTDYAKLATAMGTIISGGITISIPDVNHSEYGFKPDVENNSILYGMGSISNLGVKVMQDIIAKRPFVSIEDFSERTSANKVATINLIKGGAFDNMYSNDRYKPMEIFINMSSKPKKRITLQNFNGLINEGMVPSELDFQISVYKYTKVIRKHFKFENSFKLNDDEVLSFFMENLDTSLLSQFEDGCYGISQSVYDKYIYKPHMDKVRAWLKQNHDDLLSMYNQILFDREWNKYCSGTISQWEMESISFYYHEHELSKVNNGDYNFQNFGDLPLSPKVDRIWKNGLNNIPIYKITKIIGTVIGKDKAKSTINLLTTDGVVPMRFRKEQFAIYDKQISELDPTTGKKHIVEKSWFKRGSKLMVSGFRREAQFVPKKYSKTPWHSLYKIDKVRDDGSVVMRHERWGTDE